MSPARRRPLLVERRFDAELPSISRVTLEGAFGGALWVTNRQP